MAGWFDENAPTGRPGRPRTPGYQVPANDTVVTTTTPANPNGTPSSGNTGVAGDQSGTTVTPPTSTRTAENNPGLDPAKWLAGHTSPKYAFMEVAKKHDQRTDAGRQATLKELQTLHPKWFGGWTIAGDKLRYGGDPKSLDGKWNGYNEFDAWRGSKAGEWAPQWIPTQLNGQAYVDPAAQPQTGATTGAATTANGAPGTLPPSPMAVSGSASNGGAQSAMPVNVGAGGGGYLANDDYSGFGSLLQPWDYEFAFPYFQAPEGEEVFNDPGYQFRREQGEKAIERSASAQGTVLNPATVKALEDYNSGLASQEYGQVYNRRLGEHGRAHDQAFNEFTSAYGVFQNNQDRPFNKLASLAGLGQTSAGQLGAAGSAFAGNYGQMAMSGAGAQADYWTQAGNAGAAGRVGGANAWNQALGNIGNNAMGSYYANQWRPRPAPGPNPFSFGTPASIGTPPGYGGGK